MTDIRLPRLLDGDLREAARLTPAALTIESTLTPLSTATLELPPDGPHPALGQFIELYTAKGSAGVFRVQQAEHSATGSRLTLEHGLCTLRDHVYPGDDAPHTTTAAEAFAALLNSQTTWQLGQVEVPADQLVTWRAEGVDLLSGLLGIAELLPGYAFFADQTATPWQLHFRALTDASPSECRLTRNLRSLRVEQDRSQLCTRLIVPGQDAPLDAPTLATWGPVIRTFSADAGLTEEEILARAQQYLATHQDPQLTVTLDATDLCALTGCSLDRFLLGHLCRVCLPEQQTAITQRVVALRYPDVYGQPDAVQITLSTKAATAGKLLSSLIVDTTALRRQNLRQWNDAVAQRDLLIQAEESITLHSQQIALKADATTVDGLTTRMTSAEVNIDGVNAAITLKAEKTTVDGLGERVSAAEIAIDGANSLIALKADKIDLDGYVTMQDFEALEGTVEELHTNWGNFDSMSVNTITGGTADFDVLQFGQCEALDNVQARAVESMSVSGNTLTITLYDGTSVNFSKASVIALDQIWSGGRLSITTSTSGVTLSGETTAIANTTPQNLAWNGNTASFDVTCDRGTIVNGMQVDATDVYNTGWNACRDACSYASNVYTISENAPGTLYMQVNGNYTSVGSSWVKVTAKTGLYYRPNAK